MNHKFNYEEKIKFYEKALRTFRLNGPWICNVLADAARQRGIRINDSTSFCKENFPEFWEEVELHGTYPRHKSSPPAFPETEQGNLMRQAALTKAIDKCNIYLGLTPPTSAFYIRPRSFEDRLFIEEMEKFKWPEIQISMDYSLNYLNPQYKTEKMKEENLIRGNRLSDEIAMLKRQIDGWEESTKFANDGRVAVTHDNTYTANSVSVPAEAFSVIKTISLSFLKNRLHDLKQQLEAL